MSVVEVPNFITPISIASMTEDEQDRLLKRVRESRLHAYHVFVEAEKMKQEIRNEKLRKKLEAQLRMLEKEIARLDKVEEALTKRIGNIQSIRLEMGETT